MLKRILTLSTGMIVGSLLAMGLIHVVQLSGIMGDRDVSKSARYYGQVVELVRERYVDADRVDPEALTRDALRGMLRSLDPHSNFLAASDYSQLQEDIDSKFGGIGVQIEFREGFVVVIAPISGTPGERAGILRGDRVLAINGESMVGSSLNEVVAQMRGKPGDPVEITFERQGEEEPVEITVVREVIKVKSVTDVMMLSEEIGYLRIAQFSAPTAEELRDAMQQLANDGMRSLVIDVRNNPGGLLSSAKEVLDPFFEQGELMVYTEGRTAADREEFRSTSSSRLWNYPTVVLINSGSASAAEILAGALQDTGKAHVVGETSFGKGSVQSLIRLRAGEGIRLTTGRYYMPSGVTVHEVGVIPDEEVVMSPEDDLNVALQRSRRDLSDPAEFEARFGFAPIPDLQLEAALAHLRESADEAQP
ncbi:MAG: S41 family peptidase [Synoicihabitans sp.]